MNDIDSIVHSLKLASDSELLLRYINLRFIREVELLISQKYSDQIFRCPVHLSIGQEAIAVGISMNLTTQDQVISTHRSHAHYLAKGGSLYRMFAEIMGSHHGCCGGRGGSMHLIDTSVGFMGSIPIVGSSLPISSGLAFAQKKSKSGNIVVAFVGDAVMETGAFYETLNIIALKELPLLVVIEDNGYSTFANKSVRVPQNRNTRTIVEGFGIEYFSGNGDNLNEVFELGQRLVATVRESKPTVVELSTFRMLEHCGPNNDDHLGYRPDEEIASHQQRDPLDILIKQSSKSLNFMDLDGIDQFVSKYVHSVYRNALIQREKEEVEFRESFGL